ncbi:hypothetical protein BHM03_00033257 [Ensete ventricosum]|nr:hypothetical protein BHM03_00033257 [Ensete ventricosum]
MLAKGFVVGKDALKRARSLDERHHFLSAASATIASLDRKMGLSEKITTGTAMVSGKVREVDEQFQVSGITRSAVAATEQMASNAGSAIMSNHYVSTGASWVSSALSKVAKAAEDVSTMTKEKVEKAEEQRKEIISRDMREMVSEFAQDGHTQHCHSPLHAERLPLSINFTSFVDILVADRDQSWNLPMINKINLVQPHAAEDLLRKFLLLLGLHQFLLKSAQHQMDEH